MKSVKIIYIFFLVILPFTSILSQDINKERYRTVTVPLGDNSLIPTPSDESERVKYVIKIEIDAVSFLLKANLFEKGVLSQTPGPHNGIISNIKVSKGNELFFEMVPDISNPAKLTLFTYFHGQTSCSYLLCDDNKQIKYNKFEVVSQKESNLIPLLLCYVDDKQKNTEKILNKYLKNNLITITSNEEIKDKILKYFEKCLFVYYVLSD